MSCCAQLVLPYSPETMRTTGRSCSEFPTPSPGHGTKEHVPAGSQASVNLFVPEDKSFQNVEGSFCPFARSACALLLGSREIWQVNGR